MVRLFVIEVSSAKHTDGTEVNEMKSPSMCPVLQKIRTESDWLCLKLLSLACVLIRFFESRFAKRIGEMHSVVFIDLITTGSAICPCC